MFKIVCRSLAMALLADLLWQRPLAAVCGTILDYPGSTDYQPQLVNRQRAVIVGLSGLAD